MSSPAGERPPGAYPAYPESVSPLPGPPLTKRMRTRHWVAIDCVAGAFIALCDLAVSAQFLPRVGNTKLPLALLFMATVFFPVALRRRAPVTAFGGLVILGVLLSTLSPLVTAMVFLAAAYVLYTVTVESRRRTGAAALGLVLVVSIFLGATGHGGGPRSSEDVGVLVPVALANIIAWMTGYSVRQRRLWDTSDLHDPRVVAELDATFPWYEQATGRLERYNRALLWRALTGDAEFDLDHWVTRVSNRPQEAAA